MRPTATPVGAGQPVRADAARNRDRVLAAARSVFTRQGADASLHEVARFAGVGVGTVYRHFATREALLEAVLSDQYEVLRRQAAEPDPELSPADAVTAWMGRFLRHLTTYRGLAAAMLPVMHQEGTPLYRTCRDMRTALAGLLQRAQQAGAIRPDLDAATVLKLTNAVALVADQTADDPAHLLDYLLTGLRPPS